MLRGTAVSKHAQIINRVGIEPLVPVGKNGYYKDDHKYDPPDRGLNGKKMDRLHFGEIFTIVDVDYLKPVGDYKFENEFEANRFMDNLVKNGNHQKGSLVVVSETELN